MSSRLVLPLAIAVYALACTLWTGGFLDDRPWGDPGIYEGYAHRMFAGDFPYRAFYVEYPPGAIPAFLAPELVVRATGLDYLLSFRLLSALLGLGALVASDRILVRVGAPQPRRIAALLVIATAPAALGHVFLNRYDTWPTLLVVLGLLALLVRRELAASAALAGAVVTKIFALAAAPVAAVRVGRTAGRRRLLAAFAAFAAVGLLVAGPFLAAAIGGVGFSFYSQATRQLHVESLGGSILLALDQLGLYRSRIVAGLAIDLAGPVPDALGIATSLVQAGAVAAVAWAYAAGRERDERLVAAVATAITAFVVFGKALSPQYLVWLVPLVPLVTGRLWRTSTALFVLALVLTQIELRGYVGLTIADWAVWTLLARNATLVALLLVLFAGLWPGRRAAEAT